jgi:hypothetical protein
MPTSRNANCSFSRITVRQCHLFRFSICSFLFGNGGIGGLGRAANITVTLRRGGSSAQMDSKDKARSRMLLQYSGNVHIGLRLLANYDFPFFQVAS